jgi:hypothetical protein
MFKLKRINEDYRASDRSLSDSIKKFVEKNKDHLDQLASEDMWDEINSFLSSNFPEEDEDYVVSAFSKIYGAPVDESGEDEKYDHRNVSRIPAMPYSGMGKISMGVNQKLTESRIIRISNFK